MSTLRLKYRKGTEVRFISHLDTGRALRRALNRAGIALAYSQGFSPRPKISFGPPLAVGHLSETEYMDIVVAEPIDPRRLADRLNAVLPAGLEVVWAGKVPPDSPSVSAAITELEYRALVPFKEIGDRENAEREVQKAMEKFQQADELILERERKGRIQRFDLKQQVPMLNADCGSDGVEVTVRISVGQAGFPKPEEVLREVFSLDEERTKNVFMTRADVGFGAASGRAKGARRSGHES